MNGMSKAFDILVRNLSSHGWNVRTVNTADRTPDRIQSAFSFSRAARIGGAVGRACLELPNVDVVYVAIAQSRLGFVKDALVVNAAAAAGRPVVAHMHGGNFSGFYEALSKIEQALVQRTLDRISRVVVLAEGLKSDFRMMREWPARTVPISNACDVPMSPPRQLHRGRLRVLYLSNLIVSKGYREVVLAVSDLAKERPALQVRLDVAGSLSPGTDFPDAAAQQADLEHLFSQLPATVAANYHGPVDGLRKQTLLREADVFVLPTWYINEGQPIAVLEALTSALPVVATDWRGIRESLPDEMASLLVPPRDPSAIGTRLAWLVDRPDFFSAMSRSAIVKADDFRPDRHMEAVEKVLRTTLHESARYRTRSG
jgi:glycosyltransferase involved in cell wall biosynthesis